MKIVIDGRMYGLEHAGIGRYVLNLISYLEKTDQDNHYWILLRDKYFKTVHFTNPNFKKVRVDLPHYSLAEQLFLPLKLFSLKADIVHFPHFNVPLFYFGRFVVTIHDLIKHEFKGKQTTTKAEILYWPKYFLYRLLTAITIKRASIILTPSLWWRKRLTDKYGVPAAKIIVTYEGASEFNKFKFNKKQAEKLLTDLKIKKPYLIYVGNLYPHKNVERLVMAVKKLRKEFDLQLVIAGSRNIFFDRFRQKTASHLITSKNGFVNLVGFQDNEQLFYLYRQSVALVFPSLLEGFGLPGLEAFAAQTVVIASNNSCLPEIYGGGAIYFNPLDINDMASKIRLVLKDGKKGKQLIDEGTRQLKKYNWQKMASETLAAYHQAVFKNRP